MVEIKNAVPGQYRVIIKAKIGDTVKHPAQDFALVASTALAAAVPLCGDTFEPNDTQPLAFKYLDSGQSITARTCSASDLDFYEINVQKTGGLAITVTTTDTPLRITLTGNGLPATILDVPAQSTKTVNTTAFVGLYDIEVEPTGPIGSTSTYTLTATFSVPASTRRHRSASH